MRGLVGARRLRLAAPASLLSSLPQHLPHPRRHSPTCASASMEASSERNCKRSCGSSAATPFQMPPVPPWVGKRKTALGPAARVGGGRLRSMGCGARRAARAATGLSSGPLRRHCLAGADPPPAASLFAYTHPTPHPPCCGSRWRWRAPRPPWPPAPPASRTASRWWAPPRPARRVGLGGRGGAAGWGRFPGERRPRRGPGSGGSCALPLSSAGHGERTQLALKLYGRMNRSAMPGPITRMIHSSKVRGLPWEAELSSLASTQPVRHLICGQRVEVIMPRMGGWGGGAGRGPSKVRPPHPDVLARRAHLVLRIQCRDVVLEGVSHPAPLKPHVADALQGVPGFGAGAQRCKPSLQVSWGGGRAGLERAPAGGRGEGSMGRSVQHAPVSSRSSKYW